MPITFWYMALFLSRNFFLFFFVSLSGAVIDRKRNIATDKVVENLRLWSRLKEIVDNVAMSDKCEVTVYFRQAFDGRQFCAGKKMNFVKSSFLGSAESARYIGGLAQFLFGVKRWRQIEICRDGSWVSVCWRIAGYL